MQDNNFDSGDSIRDFVCDYVEDNNAYVRLYVYENDEGEVYYAMSTIADALNGLPMLLPLDTTDALKDHRLDHPDQIKFQGFESCEMMRRMQELAGVLTE